MKNIAIIPARSGSKGLKDKNIKKLNGIPLIAYSIFAAQSSGLFDEIMVSTDSDRYAEIAKSFGANVPFLRSEATSTDSANSWDVVREVLFEYSKQNKRFDTVCLLQPTSPLRTDEDILMGYNELEAKNADAITSVCESEHSPLWSTVLDDDLSLKEFRRSAAGNTQRQKLSKYYRLNGAIYIRKIRYINETISIDDSNEYAVIMPKRRSVDIDTQEDFKLAEFYIEKKN